MSFVKYKVIETCMFPAQWKVESIQWPGRNNSFTEYFQDRKAAEQEAQRRNRAEQPSRA